MLVAYPLPRQGASIYDKAWERTVYFFNGVWRCLESDIQQNRPALFFYFPINKFGRGDDRQKHSEKILMPQTIQLGSEMLRINPAKNTIEYSTNNGRSWHTRCTSSSFGVFNSLLSYGPEILIASTKGVLYSTNECRALHMRSSSSNNTGEFIELIDGGNELLADTSIGLLYSTNSGRTWHMRKRR